MAKTHWDALQAEFAKAHGETGISVQAWCEQQGLHYASAKRYLSVKTAKKTAKTDVRPTANSQNKVRNSGGTRALRTSGNTASDKGLEPVPPNQIETDLQRTAQKTNNKGHDDRGRFVRGEYSGNPEPVPNILPGMQLAKTHGGYAHFFPDHTVSRASTLSLTDELRLSRACAVSVLEHLNELADELTHTQDPDALARLYRLRAKAEQALDRNIARIESLERSLSALRVDEVRIPHIIEDTQRLKAAANKLAAETQRLETEGGSDTTALGEILWTLQGQGSGGMMT